MAAGLGHALLGIVETVMGIAGVAGACGRASGERIEAVVETGAEAGVILTPAWMSASNFEADEAGVEAGIEADDSRLKSQTGVSGQYQAP